MPMIVMGCLNRSLLTVESAACIIRVSFVMRDMRKPECISIEEVHRLVGPFCEKS